MTYQSQTTTNLELWALAAGRVAIIAAVFSFIVLAVLAVQFVRAWSVDPVAATRVTALKAQLALTPGDEALKTRIRETDRQAREEYFRSEAFIHDGLWLLCGGLALLLLCWKAERRWQGRPWQPQFAAYDHRAGSARSRRAVVGVGVLLAGTLLGLAVSGRQLTNLAVTGAENSPAAISETTDNPPPVDNAAGTATTTINATGTATTTATNTAGSAIVSALPGATTKQNGIAPTANGAQLTPRSISSGAGSTWPSFRGPGGRGIAPSAAFAMHWDGDKGQNICWKTTIPLPGASSPVVWGDRLFLTGADEHQRMVYCLNALTGDIRWKQPVAGLSCADTAPLSVTEDTGYAAPTAATDGAHVCAIFADGDLACFDFNGKLLWAKNMGRPHNQYGHATSLIIYKKTLILQFDQGATADEDLSALYALDIATGDVAWKTRRPVPNSWSTPIIINTGARDELITCGSPFVIGYNPTTGKELWRAECLGGDVAPSPIFAGGLIFAANSGANLAAIRPGGSGEVTKSRVVWMSQDNLPDITSPVSDGKLVFLSSQATVTCVDASTGKTLWQHDYDTPFRASPSLVGDRVYLPDESGNTHIIAAARAFKDMGASPIGEQVAATPAFAHGCIYLRGKHTLFCIGAR